MIDIKLVVILANKNLGVVNPLTYYPREFKPGHSLPEGVWSSRVVTKELGERDFSDKFLIYSECISKLKEVYRPFFRLDKLEFVSRPFSDGEFRGVAVAILEHVSAAAIILQNVEDKASGRTLTDVEVPIDLWDVVDEVHQKTPLKQKVLEAKTLPKVPEDTGADIREATIEPPVLTREELRREIERFSAAYPEEAGMSSEEHAAIAAKFWEYESRFVFTTHQAHELTGISKATLKNLAKDREGFALERDGQWFFSGTNLARYLQEEFKQNMGRPPKLKSEPQRKIPK